MLHVAFNLNIQSYFQINLLKDSYFKNDFPYIHIELNKKLRIEDKYIKTGSYTYCSDEYAIYYRQNVGIFKINFDKIEINPDKNISEIELSRVLLGLPIGYLLTLRKWLVFHGSAVEKNSDGYIFLGKSGSGKSTIAYELIEDNFKFITEDICAVSSNKLLNSFPFIKNIK